MSKNNKTYVRKTVLACCVSLLLLGCASTKYGYTPEEWGSMTQQERDEAESHAEEMVEYVHEKERENDFLHHPVNAIFESRSNVY